MNNRRRIIKRNNRYRNEQSFPWIVLPIAGALIMVCVLVILISHKHAAKQDNTAVDQTTSTTDVATDTEPTDVPPVTVDESEESEESSAIPEEEIYSFLQGPKAWKKKKAWSGSWSEQYMDIGLNFSSFGCGLCCIANIYDTLSPYEISPLDAYEFARKRSVYYPTGESGAIGWEAMSDSLDQMGVDCSLKRKPSDYSTFQYRMDNSVAAVILLLCDDEDAFWGEISGHYVVIWNYDPDNDTVFVTNPGSYKRNRKTIPLRDCYDYLKAVSPFQVLYVSGYDEAFDTWKPESGIKEKWISPKD